MGCTSSKEFQKQAKKDGWEAPMNRSQSMPVTSGSKYPARDDSFHVVALTSSTYGILKVDGPDGDLDVLPVKDKTEVDAVSEMYQKMRDFDIPEVMEPKPWAEMSFNLPQLNLQLKPKSPLVVGGLSNEPETINMWELMDGLDDDLSPFPRGSVLASPFRLRHLEKANSMFAVRTVEEIDAAVAMTVDDPTDSNRVPVGAQAGKLAKSASLGVQGAGKENAKPNSLSALMAQRSVTNSPLVSAKSAPSQVVPGHPSKVTLPSQIPSTLTKPSNSTSTAASIVVGSPVRKPNEVTASVSVCTPKLSSISGSSSTPVRPASAGRHPGSSSNEVGSPAESPPLALESGLEHISVKSTLPILAKKSSSRGVSPKIAGKIPPLSLDSSYEQISLPQSTAGNGLQVYAGLKVSPKLAERLAAFSASSPRTEHVSSPRASANVKAEDWKSSVKQVVPLTVAPGTGQRRSLGDNPEVTYVNNFPSSPDESEDTNSPLFDPDLLASFEKAFEQISEDDWYAVRTGGETTSSGSTTDVESPVQRGGRDGTLYLEKSSGADVNAKGNKISQVIPELVQQTPSKAAAEVKNLKKVSSSKVSPLAIDEKVIPVKEDPLDKFERKCPPGGEERVVLYVTSLRGIRKTFEDCNNLRMILQSFSVLIDERDVAMHSQFRQELKDLMGKPVPVPRVFIKGRYVGGQEEVAQLHEEGVLALLVDGLPTEKSRAPCDGCGGVRFVPCMECSGSCKVLTEEDEVVRCPDCNENGLMRCPICF